MLEEVGQQVMEEGSAGDGGGGSAGDGEVGKQMMEGVVKQVMEGSAGWGVREEGQQVGV